MTNNSAPPLNPDELAIWHALKRLSETSLALVAAAIEAASGLSGADFGVLSRLEDLGSGTMTQQALVRSLGWNKARLSHQLTRMQTRGLLRRDTPAEGRGVLVSILPAGSQAIAAARPAHATAIRRHVLRHLNADEARSLVEIARRLEMASDN